MKIKNNRLMYGDNFTTWNYLVEGSYYFEEEVPTQEFNMNLVEAWNSGSL